MLYLAFAFNTLVLAAFVFELHQARKERQSLALLIKSQSVGEFVRAERMLESPTVEPDEPDEPELVELEDADPQAALEAIEGKEPPATA